MIDLEMILEISRKYSFSTAAIGQIIELLCFRNELNEELQNNSENKESIKNKIEDFIKLIQKPQRWYTLRLSDFDKVNSSKYETTIKTLENYAKQYGSEGICDDAIPNIFYFKITGPHELETNEKAITVDKFAAESVMIGAHLYVPGFNKVAYEFVKDQEVSIYGPGHFHVANGVTKINSSELLKVKTGIGIENKQSKYLIPSYRESELYTEGSISDQNFSSILACWTLMSKYQEDSIILDMCSAPGHKTCGLSQIGTYLNGGTAPKIITVDRSTKRLQSLIYDVERLHLKNIEVLPIKIQRLGEKHPELIESNDLVVLDPPCSALGTRPKIRIEHSWKDYRSFFLLQRSFVKDIDKFVKPGGFLLYNTCTLTLLENEAIVSYILDKFNYELIDIRKIIRELFPNRFYYSSNSTEDVFSGDPNSFGYEIKSGFSRDDSNYELLLDSNQITNKSRTFQLENLEDLLKYHTIKSDNALKVCRTLPETNNTTGYFFALFHKKN